MIYAYGLRIEPKHGDHEADSCMIFSESFGLQKIKLNNRDDALNSDSTFFVLRCKTAYPCFLVSDCENKNLDQNSTRSFDSEVCWFVSCNPKLSTTERRARRDRARRVNTAISDTVEKHTERSNRVIATREWQSTIRPKPYASWELSKITLIRVVSQG